MGIFGDLGRMAREVKSISDEFTGIKNDVVASAKDLAKQAIDTETIITSEAKNTISETKKNIINQVKKSTKL